MTAGTQREIRRLAFQALFQLDARADSDPGELGAALEDIAAESAPTLSRREVEGALALALDAYRRRREADQAVSELAPDWPAPRQPAVDRAILRLAFHEMTLPGARPKVVVNEAIELAKRYSTERSPAFVNGVLDKILKSLPAGTAPPPTGTCADDEAAGGGAP